MKQISREINSYLMDLDNCTNPRSEFNKLYELEQFIINARKNLYTDEEGYSYFTKAADIMMTDIADYLNKYKKEKNMPCNDLYRINVAQNQQSKRMMLNIPAHGLLKHYGNLRQNVDEFPRYMISYILGLDLIFGEEFAKKNKYLIKEEYDRFMGLRSANSIYFEPFIRNIIMSMETVEVVK